MLLNMVLEPTKIAVVFITQSILADFIITSILSLAPTICELLLITSICMLLPLVPLGCFTAMAIPF